MDIIELKKIFRLNDSGKLERLGRYGNWRVVAENNNLRYTQLGINKKSYYYHRIVWVIFNGMNIPHGLVVDHIDNNSHNNDPKNLQITTQQINNMKDETFKLPSKVNNKYCLSVSSKRINVYLGIFAKPDDYWMAHSKMQTLFGVDTKGRDVITKMANDDVREFVKLAWEVSND